MASKVFTGGDGMVSQIAMGRVIQPADPVQVLPNMAPAALPHLNTSLQIINPAGSITERGTQVANRYSALDGMPIKHPPPVAKGQTVPFRDKENGFLSWAKDVFKEGGQMVMNGVSTGVNAIVTVLAPEAKQFMVNAEKVVTGLTLNDFKEAGQDLGEDVMAALQDPQTYIGLATTLAAVAAQGIPVVGQVVGGALAVQRVAGVAEASVQAAQELAELAKMWTQPMSPAQLADARQRLAKFLTGAGLSILMAVAGKSIRLRPRAKSSQTVNSNKPVETNKTGPPPKTGCACALGNPVIIATGEKLLEETDFDLPGLIPLVWRRRYRSGDVEQGWFGQGWSTPYGVDLRLNAQGLLFKDEQGRAIDLPRLAVGQQHFEPYEKFTVHHPQPDEWMLEFKSGTQYWFTRHHPSQWRLPLGAIADRNGNVVHLFWKTEAGLAADAAVDPFAAPELQRIEDSAGRVLELDWQHMPTPNRPSGTTRLAEVRLVQGPRDGPGIEARSLARYHYSAEGDLIASERGGLPYRQYAWREHMLVAYRKATGHRYGIAYDNESPAGRVLRSWSVDDTPGAENPGTVLADHFSYAPFCTTHTDALGRRTLYETDARGDIVAVTDPAGNRQATPFDARGNRAAAVDALGRRTEYRHDARGNLITITDPAGASTRLSYNALDLPVSITDALGQTWLSTYDARGNLIEQVDPLGQHSRYRHEARGLPVDQIDAKGGRKQLRWNQAGQLTAYTDCSGRTTEFAYDAQGAQIAVRDAAGQQTQAQVDALGRITRLIEPALPGQPEPQHRFDFDGEGNLLSYVNPIGAATRYSYDGAGQPLLREDAEGGSLQYEYDAARRLVGLINENGARYALHYDAADNLSDEIGFDGRHQRYAYNAAGDLTHLIETGGSDAGPGKVTWFERDAASRLLAKRHSQDPQGRFSSRFAYDRLGRLLQADNTSSQVSFAYDALSRLLRETQGLLNDDGTAATEFAFEHSYDELGNRIHTALPSGRRVQWLRYGSGHVHQINIASRAADGSWAPRVVSDIERDALHREVSRSQGGVASRFEHDPMGRLVAQRVAQAQATQGRVASTRAATVAGLQRQYAYDAAGNLRATQDSLRGLSRYEYDRLGRVLSGIKAGQAEHFAFDPAGNLLQQPGSRIADNRVHVFQDLRMQYDAHGNVTHRSKGWHTEQEFSYGPEHQLRQATVQRRTDRQDPQRSVSQTTHYRYDALGRRVAKTDAFGSTHFAYDGDLLATEQRGSKAAEFLYEDGSFVPLARIEGTAGAPDYEIQYYHCDQIGAPQELSDEQGRIVWAASYKVWGEVQPVKALATGTDGGATQLGARTALRSVSTATGGRQGGSLGVMEQPLRFQGQYFDAETGLHYNRFRYYDPVVGRFTSQDPIGLLGGLNQLMYAPSAINWLDPLGLACNPRNATHITYQGMREGKPYVGYASMPGRQSADTVLRYRYGGSFSSFDGDQPPRILFSGYGQSGKDTARGLEQRTFEKLGGLDKTANAQNPVGKNNSRRKKYLAAADKHNKCNCPSIVTPSADCE